MLHAAGASHHLQHARRGWGRDQCGALATNSSDLDGGLHSVSYIHWYADILYGVMNSFCSFTNTSVSPTWMDGGISSFTHALIATTASRVVIKQTRVAGGDAFISICLWRAGFAFTDPGPGFFDPKIQMFDPGPEDTLGAMVWLAHALLDKCNALCKVRPSMMHELCVCRSQHACRSRQHVFPAHFLWGLAGL